VVEASWLVLEGMLFSTWLPGSGWRRTLLRMFGARIGAGVVIKSRVRVKFPWRLTVGEHAWIGESCWIDNLAPVEIGSHSCLSQGVYLCTGNHDWNDPAFALRCAPIRIGAGAWIGAMSRVGPGVVVGEGAVITLASVVQCDVGAGVILGGPAGTPRGIRRAQSG